MKKWFSNCFPLLYICLHCDEVCVCWHFGAPGTPGFYVRARHDPEKIKLNSFYFFHIFYFNSKVFIRLLLNLTCKLLLNGGYILCEPRWAQSDYWSPPPPPGPHLAKDVKKKIDKNVHQITYIFYILLSFGVILRCLWGLEAYIYIMFMSSVDQCMLI